MKYTDSDLVTDINTEIDALRASNKDTIDPAVVAFRVFDGYREGFASGDTRAVAFARHTSYAAVRKLATTCLNKLEPEPDEDGSATQARLPGFETDRLQSYYVNERNGTKVAVRIDLMTDEEVEQKAAHYSSNARQLNAHAAELMRYLGWRRDRRSRGIDVAPEFSPTHASL